jgi:hypothetical protein
MERDSLIPKNAKSHKREYYCGGQGKRQTKDKEAY